MAKRRNKWRCKIVKFLNPKYLTNQYQLLKAFSEIQYYLIYLFCFFLLANLYCSFVVEFMLVGDRLTSARAKRWEMKGSSGGSILISSFAYLWVHFLPTLPSR